jgi:exonuclease VII small subunit
MSELEKMVDSLDKRTAALEEKFWTAMTDLTDKISTLTESVKQSKELKDDIDKLEKRVVPLETLAVRVDTFVKIISFIFGTAFIVNLSTVVYLLYLVATVIKK